MTSPGTTRLQANAGRGTFLRWLRTTHRYVGLWGALLGLLFGVSGFFLNHRAVLKIPAATIDERTVRMPLPASPPTSAGAMATWLRQTLDLDRPAARVRTDAAKAVPWGDRPVVQPEHWQISFTTPQRAVLAEYWVGDRSVTVRRTDGNFVAMLSNFHKGTGLGVGWVLLVDTLAGSIVLLSLSGVLLWTRLSRRRLAGAGVIAVVLGTGLVLALQAL